MNLPRIYISAAHKSSGKTTLSLGLCAALSRMGKKVQPFKKGPDYIDPLWLGAASNNACYNLDFNTMTHDEIACMLEQKSRNKDIVLIEGNKGLYDGVALDGSTSNAAMAVVTKTPVVLVIDAQGVTRGVAPLLLGYQSFDSAIHIAGVIFNKVGGVRHENKLREVTEHYTDIPVLGCVQKSDDLILTERHLGLMPYNETDKALGRINLIADRIQEQVDLEQFLAVAATAPECPDYNYERLPYPQGEKVRIGVCRDASFGFYYTDDLEALEQSGAELIMINTLTDAELPKLDGLFIGGGFPETQMDKLSTNQSMRQSIHDAIEAGLPVYAECGGLMYLSESVEWHRKTYPMVGVIPAPTKMYEKPQGRGYVKLSETSEMPWPEYGVGNSVISAHEFHYSKLEDLQGKLTQKGRFAYCVERGYGIDGQHDGWLYNNLLASYSHMRDTSKYHWAERFVEFIRLKKGSKHL